MTSSEEATSSKVKIPWQLWLACGWKSRPSILDGKA